jgi:hypothetical protein
MNQGVHNRERLEDTKRRFVEFVNTEQISILRSAFPNDLHLYLTLFIYKNKHHYLVKYKSDEG